MKIGILAYGLLIDDPRKEIEDLKKEVRDGILTPFHVEFARKSGTRKDAPTLVPVVDGGSHVNAKLLVLKENTTLEIAKNALYHRESGQKGEYKPNPNNKNQVYVEILKDTLGIDYVLYTKIMANIICRTPKYLACLAIKSAEQGGEKNKKDGISYLINAKKNGIYTALSNEYEEEILKQTGSKTLEEAWEKCVHPKVDKLPEK